MKLLLVKSSSMGDIVHALPVATDIREHFPDAQIDWVAEESFKDIPRLSPHVSDIIVTAFRRWAKHWHSRQTWSEIQAVRTRVRSGHYDMVIDLQGLARTGVVTSWAHAPAAGFSFSTVREKPAALAYSRGMRFSLEETLGAVHRYRLLAAKALGYQPEGRPRFGLRPYVPNPVPVDASYACFAVNTSQDRKLWPEAKWVEVGKSLETRGIRSILFWGNPVEKSRVERIAKDVPGSIVAPRLPLSEISSVLSDACLVVGVDTGITHLGAALGRPTVGIFVETSLDKVPVVGDGRYINLGGPGQMPEIQDVLKSCEDFLR